MQQNSRGAKNKIIISFVSMRRKGRGNKIVFSAKITQPDDGNNYNANDKLIINTIYIHEKLRNVIIHK
jgi:hypothetical protein